MIRKILVVVITLALLTLAASPGLAKEITVRGKLEKTVEAGGWLIVAGKQKYLILNPQKFQSEKWFKEGTDVEAIGETKNVMTIYMEGTPFEVRSMRPFERRESGTGAADRKSLTRVMLNSSL